MIAPQILNPFTDATEIVAGDVSGGTNTSHTIVVPALAALLNAVPAGATLVEYGQAVVERNALGKQTDGARRRTFRYLRELYILRPDSVLFRAMRDLWPVEEQARPLLACICALARDAVFRASSTAILRSSLGDVLTALDMTEAVREKFPSSYSENTLGKIGRNTSSSWEQAGHLAGAGRSAKLRVRATCPPSAAAYALLLGHLQGIRGRALFETLWAKVLDQPTSQLVDLAAAASQRGMLEFRNAGGIIDVGFRELLRPFDAVSTGRLL